jgi:cytochrome d ubiquinol oxidase subunit I
MRTKDGASPSSSVPAGPGIFTLLGFTGLYVLIAILYVVFVLRILARGPDEGAAPAQPEQAAVAAG